LALTTELDPDSGKLNQQAKGHFVWTTKWSATKKYECSLQCWRHSTSTN